MGRFNDLLRDAAQNIERREATAELAGKTIKLYAKPLTGSDLDKIMARHKSFASAPTLAAVIDLLIMKVEDESGEKAFDVVDKPFLLVMPVHWINKLQRDLFPDQEMDLSDAAIDAEMGN